MFQPHWAHFNNIDSVLIKSKKNMTISSVSFSESAPFLNKFTDRKLCVQTISRGHQCLLLILIKTSHDYAMVMAHFLPVNQTDSILSVKKLRTEFFSHIFFEKKKAKKIPHFERSTKFHCWNVSKLYRLSRDLFLDSL